MYKDDVMLWGRSSGKSRRDWFDLYTQQYIGVNVDCIQNIRNFYVHGFDEELGELYSALLSLSVSDVMCLCNYFGIAADSTYLLECLYESKELISNMLNLEESNGSKES